MRPTRFKFFYQLKINKITKKSIKKNLCLHRYSSKKPISIVDK